MKFVNLKALRFVTIFLAVSFLWELLSIKLLLRLGVDIHKITNYHSYIGLIFVIVLSLIIYFIIKKEIEKKLLFEKQLFEEQRKINVLLETASDAIFILDKNNNFIDCNKATLELFQCTKEKLLKSSILEFSPEYQPGKIKSSILAKEKTELARKGIIQNFEWVHTNFKKTKEIYCEISFNIQQISGEEYSLAIVKDISKRKAAELSLKESEEKYKAQFNYFPIPLYSIKKINNELIFNDYNNATKEYPFIQENEILNRKITDFFYKGKEKELVETINKTFLNKETNKIDLLYEFKTTGKKRYMNMVAGYVPSGTVLLSMQDITDKKNAHEKLLHAMMNAEERERSRIAKDLHDGVSPILAAIKLYLQTYLSSSDEIVKSEISKKIFHTMDEAIHTVSDISNKLSPHILRNFGLSAAIQSVIDKVSELTNLHFSFFYDVNKELFENIKTNIYRVAVELINNTVKYGEASKVVFKILEKEDNLKINFEHNGKGFNFDEVRKMSKGMGLHNILNRIKSLNGEIEIITDVSSGVMVNIIIPLLK